MGRIRMAGGFVARMAAVVAAIVAVIALLAVLSAVRLLPQFRNPFAETTTISSEPVLLKSITALSRYEAASGSFQVVVDLNRRSSWLPSFIEGSQTLFIGDGTDIAYVDFSQLNGKQITISKDRTAVTIRLPAARLEPVALDLRHSYVLAQQQGLFNRLATFFSGNPNSQQQLYISAQQQIQVAAAHSQLIPEAEQNTRRMLTGLLQTLGYQRITITFAPN